ncbi:MAG: ester cyclase, partial [candidate division WOR-3 bacterium]
DFTLTHPVPGRVQLGPEGMIRVWSHFKAALPDSWHPIPILIAEGDYLANLLPTYGTFNGQPHQGTPPTGKWLEYGMVNIVRLKDAKLVEAWFGMDPVAEAQQMGAAPSPAPRRLTGAEKANIELFQKTLNTEGRDFDNLTAFGDAVIAASPPQHAKNATTRKVEIYRAADGKLEQVYSHEFATVPPYAGDPAADTDASRALVKRFFEQVLRGHDVDALAEIASPRILIHPTAMPCESDFYGVKGAGEWLARQWQSFPDLSASEEIVVASGDIVAVHWQATGTSGGDFLMLPSTGNTVEYTGSSMYRIEDGTIAEIWETRNTLGIMRQLNPKMSAGHP